MEKEPVYIPGKIRKRRAEIVSENDNPDCFNDSKIEIFNLDTITNNGYCIAKLWQMNFKHIIHIVL